MTALTPTELSASSGGGAAQGVAADVGPCGLNGRGVTARSASKAGEKHRMQKSSKSQQSSGGKSQNEGLNTNSVSGGGITSGPVGDTGVATDGVQSSSAGTGGASPPGGRRRTSPSNGSSPKMNGRRHPHAGNAGHLKRPPSGLANQGSPRRGPGVIGGRYCRSGRGGAADTTSGTESDLHAQVGSTSPQVSSRGDKETAKGMAGGEWQDTKINGVPSKDEGQPSELALSASETQKKNQTQQPTVQQQETDWNVQNSGQSGSSTSSALLMTVPGVTHPPALTSNMAPLTRLPPPQAPRHNTNAGSQRTKTFGAAHDQQQHARRNGVPASPLELQRQGQNSSARRGEALTSSQNRGRRTSNEACLGDTTTSLAVAKAGQNGSVGKRSGSLAIQRYTIEQLRRLRAVPLSNIKPDGLHHLVDRTTAVHKGQASGLAGGNMPNGVGCLPTLRPRSDPTVHPCGDSQGAKGSARRLQETSGTNSGTTTVTTTGTSSSSWKCTGSTSTPGSKRVGLWRLDPNDTQTGGATSSGNPQDWKGDETAGPTESTNSSGFCEFTKEGRDTEGSAERGKERSPERLNSKDTTDDNKTHSSALHETSSEGATVQTDIKTSNNTSRPSSASDAQNRTTLWNIELGRRAGGPQSSTDPGEEISDPLGLDNDSEAQKHTTPGRSAIFQPGLNASSTLEAQAYYQRQRFISTATALLEQQGRHSEAETFVSAMVNHFDRFKNAQVTSGGTPGTEDLKSKAGEFALKAADKAIDELDPINMASRMRAHGAVGMLQGNENVHVGDTEPIWKRGSAGSNLEGSTSFPLFSESRQSGDDDLWDDPGVSGNCRAEMDTIFSLGDIREAERRVQAGKPIEQVYHEATQALRNKNPASLTLSTGCLFFPDDEEDEEDDRIAVDENEAHHGETQRDGRLPSRDGHGDSAEFARCGTGNHQRRRKQGPASAFMTTIFRGGAGSQGLEPSHATAISEATSGPDGGDSITDRSTPDAVNKISGKMNVTSEQRLQAAGLLESMFLRGGDLKDNGRAGNRGQGPLPPQQQAAESAASAVIGQLLQKHHFSPSQVVYLMRVVQQQPQLMHALLEAAYSSQHARPESPSNYGHGHPQVQGKVAGDWGFLGVPPGGTPGTAAQHQAGRQAGLSDEDELLHRWRSAKQEAAAQAQRQWASPLNGGMPRNTAQGTTSAPWNMEALLNAQMSGPRAQNRPNVGSSVGRAGLGLPLGNGHGATSMSSEGGALASGSSFSAGTSAQTMYGFQKPSHQQEGEVGHGYSGGAITLHEQGAMGAAHSVHNPGQVADTLLAERVRQQQLLAAVAASGGGEAVRRWAAMTAQQNAVGPVGGNLETFLRELQLGSNHNRFLPRNHKNELDMAAADGAAMLGRNAVPHSTQQHRSAAASWALQANGRGPLLDRNATHNFSFHPGTIRLQSPSAMGPSGPTSGLPTWNGGVLQVPSSSSGGGSGMGFSASSPPLFRPARPLSPRGLERVPHAPNVRGSVAGASFHHPSPLSASEREETWEWQQRLLTEGRRAPATAAPSAGISAPQRTFGYPGTSPSRLPSPTVYGRFSGESGVGGPSPARNSVAPSAFAGAGPPKTGGGSADWRARLAAQFNALPPAQQQLLAQQFLAIQQQHQQQQPHQRWPAGGGASVASRGPPLAQPPHHARSHLQQHQQQQQQQHVRFLQHSKLLPGTTASTASSTASASSSVSSESLSLKVGASNFNANAGVFVPGRMSAVAAAAAFGPARSRLSPLAAPQQQQQSQQEAISSSSDSGAPCSRNNLPVTQTASRENVVQPPVTDNGTAASTSHAV